MTQASVLKVTANGTTTSPVVRGTWLMERILGVSPEPPPPGVPAIEPDIRGAVTVRDQLEKHRSVISCVRCHDKIDPLGMALENFDVIGGWRDHYRALDPNRSMKRIIYGPVAPPPLRYIQGQKVDAKDVMPDGRKFSDVRQFKKLLSENPDAVAEAVISRLMIYATGAPISFADRKAIQEIVQKTRQKKHGFRSLIHAVVQSPLFQQK